MKTIVKKWFSIPGLLLLLCTLGFNSCSEEDETVDSATLIKRYGLVGAYTFSVSPLLGGIAVTTGTINGTITDEGNGVLRLVYSGFQASPMPFAMSVDVQMTLSESSKGLTVHNVDGKGFFDADPPDDPSSVGDVWELPEEALAQGVHSGGASVISGEYKAATDGNMQFDLVLDPAVNLPVTISIKTIKKLN